MYEVTVIKFEKRTKHVDISTISDGDFYINYKMQRNVIVKSIQDAKKTAGRDIDSALELFKEVHAKHALLEELLIDNEVHIRRAIARFTSRKLVNIILWLLAAIGSGIIGSMIACSFYPDWWRSLL
ncbi:MAG: hypothetical protein LBD28_03130 [Tannerellaceae bacterium]|nr:hypothetical protein [Tannerellaceae bacterium]